MEILIRHEKHPLNAAVFDFDGTLSTLRCGWEKVMSPMMEEYILGPCSDARTAAEVRDEVSRYIDESTGIQTISQMKWLETAVRAHGLNPDCGRDAWYYKDEYNRRLMETVAKRRDGVAEGAVSRENYLVAGAEDFLKLFSDRGIIMYAASGTDTADVRREAAALGLASYFEAIDGSEPHSENNTKAAVISALLAKNAGEGLIVIGDGKVEIELGRKAGALTLGVASDEINLRGFSKTKEKRLIAAGAHAVTGDFTDIQALSDWLF